MTKAKAKAAGKEKDRTDNRSAVSGKFVGKHYATTHPRTTVHERNRSGKAK